MLAFIPKKKKGGYRSTPEKKVAEFDRAQNADDCDGGGGCDGDGRPTDRRPRPFGVATLHDAYEKASRTRSGLIDALQEAS